MGKLSNLLKWNNSVALKDEKGEPVLDEKGKPITVWLRILGDDALQKAYQSARVKSSEKRKLLRTEGTKERKDEIDIVDDASAEDCKTLIMAARGNIINTEAQVNVERPDLPTIEEIAVDPDAATLEEQEKLDEEIAKVDAEYTRAIEEYIKTRTEELEATLNAMSIEQLREEAKVEAVNISALQVYLNEIVDQKVYRAVYLDKDFKELAFDSVEDFRNAVPVILEQLREEYLKLEMEPEQLKNLRRVIRGG